MMRGKRTDCILVILTFSLRSQEVKNVEKCMIFIMRERKRKANMSPNYYHQMASGRSAHNLFHLDLYLEPVPATS